MMAAKIMQKVRQLGPYQLLAKIGEGGMGTVHLAKMDGPAGFNKLAVVKELRSDLTGASEFRELFLNEARLAARLTHPNVVHTYGANEEDGRLYLAMEYLDGQPWSRIRNALWKRGCLPYALHLKVLAEALAGLHYAHELLDYDGAPLQVVHCDVSPQNLFVTYDGLVKLVDFGVARAVIGRPTPAPDMIMGKIAYIAPEQARGDAIDRRADLFAVGVMLWEAVTGKRFLQNKEWSEARRRRVSGVEPKVREVMPNIPNGLAEICDKALALDPAERYATAAEFRDALLGFLSEEVQDVDRIRLGELVSEAFDEDRKRVHGIIERHLKPVSPIKSSIEDLVNSLHPGAAAEPVEHTLKADLTELASVSRLRDDVAMIEASHSASIRVLQRRPTLPWVVVGAALLSFGITWFASRPEPQMQPAGRGAAQYAAPARGEPTTETPRLRDDAPAPATGAVLGGAVETALHAATALREPEQPATATVQLTITAHPDEAILYLDGVMLSDNPYSARVRADHELHTVRASGIGLVTQQRMITFDRDHAVSFDLGLPRLPRSNSRPARRAPSQSSPPAPAPIYEAPPFATRTVEAGSPAPRRGRISDIYDTPLHGAPVPRAIYDEDPYR